MLLAAAIREVLSLCISLCDLLCGSLGVLLAFPLCGTQTLDAEASLGARTIELRSPFSLLSPASASSLAVACRRLQSFAVTCSRLQSFGLQFQLQFAAA